MIHTDDQRPAPITDAELNNWAAQATHAPITVQWGQTVLSLIAALRAARATNANLDRMIKGELTIARERTASSLQALIIANERATTAEAGLAQLQREQDEACSLFEVNTLKDLTALAAEYTGELRASLARAQVALEEIVNPLATIRARAESNGDRLSDMAYSIVNSVSHLQEVARKALAALKPEVKHE